MLTRPLKLSDPQWTQVAQSLLPVYENQSYQGRFVIIHHLDLFRSKAPDWSRAESAPISRVTSRSVQNPGISRPWHQILPRAGRPCEVLTGAAFTSGFRRGNCLWYWYWRPPGRLDMIRNAGRTLARFSRRRASVRPAYRIGCSRGRVWSCVGIWMESRWLDTRPADFDTVFCCANLFCIIWEK